MTNETSLFLRIEHLQKTVRSGDTAIQILRDVNLTIKQGERVAILGASGSGKTTLLGLIAGLDLPTAGKIFYKQQDLTTLDEEQRTVIRGSDIGFVFQTFQLIPSLTALENVMLPLEIQYVAPNLAQKFAQEWLEKVGLQKRLHHYPMQLSGGEQQRVAIARAFVKQPKLVLADEMTGNLDETTGQMVSDLLFSLNLTHQTTLLLVTHDPNLANRCDRRLLLKEGNLEPC